MKKFFSLLFLLFFAQTLMAQETLKVAYGTYNNKPYAFIHNDELQGGIIKDIMEEVANHMHLKIEFVQIPRKRLSQYLISGKVHVHVISNPTWYPNRKAFDWSEPLFEEHDQLVVLSSRFKEFKSLEDLKGHRIGTMLGYIYPKLDTYFKSQAITRDDVTSMANNFKKLEYKRIDALVDSNILIAYYLKNHPNKQNFIILPNTVSSHFIHAMYSKKLPISKEALDKTFTHLVESGKINNILKKYY